MFVNYYLICTAQYPCSTGLQDSAVHGSCTNTWLNTVVFVQTFLYQQAELLYITGEEGSGVDIPSHSVN